MIDQSLLSEVFDTKIIKTIKALLTHDTEFFSIRELSEKANVTVSTTFRIVKSLEKVNFVKKVHRGRIKFFQIQKSSKSYKQFAELFNQKIDILALIKAKSEDIIGSNVEIHTQKKDKNKIFLISDAEIDDISLTKEVNRETGSNIKIMSISNSHFEKMKEMDLI